MDRNELIEMINHHKAIGRFFNNIVDYGEYALTFAVVLNRKKMVKRLLEYGAKIDNCTKDKNTIFHYCAQTNSVDMFKYIIDIAPECGINDDKLRHVLLMRNKDEFTCFQYSVKYKNKEIFHAMLRLKERRIWSYGTVEFLAWYVLYT